MHLREQGWKTIRTFYKIEIANVTKNNFCSVVCFIKQHDYGNLVKDVNK